MCMDISHRHKNSKDSEAILTFWTKKISEVRIDDLQVAEDEQNTQAGKFLLGYSETMGHCEYLVNRPLPETL